MMRKMRKFDSMELFKNINKSSHYLRVDSNHPLEIRLGKNDSGQKSFRYIGYFNPAKIKSTRSIEVKHSKFNDKLGVTFSLIDDSYEEIFYLLCNDLIDSTRDIDDEHGYIYIVNRFEKWRGFTSNSRKYLPEHEIKGLIGELLFLKNCLFIKYGSSKAIGGWTGTEPLKKDFSYSDKWYEIKVTTSDKITISSIEQLESPSEGYLALYTLEKVSSETNALTINDLIDDIINSIALSQDADILRMKLMDAGYIREEHYNQYRYVVTQFKTYRVDNEFPRVDRNQIPSAISNVKYDLLISMLQDYEEEVI